MFYTFTQVETVRDAASSPHVDLAVLGLSDYFIANCISTFSSIVTRERVVRNRGVTAFWGFHRQKHHDEL